MNTDEDPVLEFDALDSLLGEDIDGIILAGSRLPEAKLLEAVSAFAAVVLVNRDISGPGRGSVGVEDRAGAAEAVSYLASKGRRRIGLLTGPPTATGTARRLAGYRDGLELRGLPFDDSIVEGCVPTIDGGEASARALLEREPRIDAILAYNDLAAIGALRALEATGRAVPDDVAVIGTDDVPYASIVRPALSTLHSDIPRLGADAMTLLLSLSDGEGPSAVPAQRQRLIIRESA